MAGSFGGNISGRGWRFPRPSSLFGFRPGEAVSSVLFFGPYLASLGLLLSSTFTASPEALVFSAKATDRIINKVCYRRVPVGPGGVCASPVGGSASYSGQCRFRLASSHYGKGWISVTPACVATIPSGAWVISAADRRHPCGCARYNLNALAVVCAVDTLLPVVESVSAF